LRREHERACRDRDRYRRDRDQLRKKIDRLEDDLDNARPNEAYNLPVRSTYTTCPLPMKENILPLKILAGERA
jgi:hypothetical protein